MDEFLLLKPYSVWIVPYTEKAKKDGYIAKFILINGMYRETHSAIVGISIKAANELKKSGFIKPIKL